MHAFFNAHERHPKSGFPNHSLWDRVLRSTHPPRQSVRDVLHIRRCAAARVQIPARIHTPAVIRSGRAVVRHRGTGRERFLSGEELLQTVAGRSALHAVADHLEDFGVGAGGLDALEGGGRAGDADRSGVRVAGAVAREQVRTECSRGGKGRDLPVVALHEAWVLHAVSCGDDTDATSRFLHDNGKDETRVDARCRADGLNGRLQVGDLFIRIVGDAPVGAGGLHGWLVQGEPANLLVPICLWIRLESRAMCLPS